MLTATSFTVSITVQGVTLVVLRCRLGEGNMTMSIRFKKGVVLLIGNYNISFSRIIKEVKLKINLILGFCEFCYMYNLTITKMNPLLCYCFLFRYLSHRNPFSSAYPKPDRGGSRLNRVCQASSLVATPSSSSWGDPEALPGQAGYVTLLRVLRLSWGL